MTTKELTSKVAIVTGAGRNIGRAMALALADGGASVVVNARSNHAEAEAVAHEIEAAGGKALVHIGDVADAAAVQAGIPDDREELPGWTRSLLPAHRRGPVRVITGRHVLPCPADAAANDGEMAGGRGGSGASAYPVSPAARTEHPAAYVLVRQSLSVIVVLQCAQKIRLNRDGNC